MAMKTYLVGDRVLTNDIEWGTIIREDYPETGWFLVRLDSGRESLADASRMLSANAAERIWGHRDPQQTTDR